MSRKQIYVHDKKRSREYVKLDTAINAGASKIKREVGWITYHVGVAGENIGAAREFDKAKDRAQELRKKLGIGKTVIIGTKHQGKGPVLDQVRFIELEDDPKVYDGPGVLGVDRFESFVKEEFPHARWAGDCVCKPDSDHRDCAAVDYFDTYANMDRMAHAALDRADWFNTKYVILRDRIYFPGMGSNYYSGVYHSHVHFSCNGGIYGKAC